jgi:hypothetical protein
VKLDLTITLGNIITIGVMLGGIFIAFQKLKERLVAIEVQMAPIWKWFTERQARAMSAEDRG